MCVLLHPDEATKTADGHWASSLGEVQHASFSWRCWPWDGLLALRKRAKHLTGNSKMRCGGSETLEATYMGSSPSLILVMGRAT